VSYLVEPCLGPPDRPLPHSHTHYWEARQIALTFAELGFDVDVIDWTNHEFVPEKPYDVVLDVRLNLERLAPLVSPDTLLIQHMETGHHLFHNAAQRQRLENLRNRRGVTIRPRRVLEENRAAETAHFGTMVGNDVTIGTYAHSGTPILAVPISTPTLFPSPENKDFARCRNRWLWFGSGGLVHKGLDLVLEAFAAMPEQHLTVCGPIHLERDFEVEFEKELFGSANITTLDWVDIAGPTFRKLSRKTLGFVYPSASEGQSGSVITCLHAGLIPITTPNSGVDTERFGVQIDNPDVASIQRAVREVSALPEEALRRRAVAGWTYARKHHTHENFAREYRRAIEEILRRWEAR